MHRLHSVHLQFQLLFLGYILLNKSSSASTANSGSAATAHQTAQVEIDANGQFSSSSSPESSTVSLDSRHSYQHLGVDYSWPTHHHDSEYFPEHRKEAYLNYVNGCNQQIHASIDIHDNSARYYNNRVNQRERFTCFKYEQDRMDMNLHQPRMMGT